MKYWKNGLALGLVLFAGCASQKAMDQKIDQEVSAQPPVTMGGPLASESHRLITESTELTQTQKDKLLALHARMAGDVKAIREEEAKLKMVFFKTLLDPKSDEKEVNAIKKRILALDRNKTNKMLSGLEEAREILGRKTLSESSRLYRAFLEERAGPFGLE